MPVGEFYGLVDYLETDGGGEDRGEGVDLVKGGADRAFFGGVGGDHNGDGARVLCFALKDC